MPTKAELEEQVAELEAKLIEVADQEADKDQGVEDLLERIGNLTADNNRLAKLAAGETPPPPSPEELKDFVTRCRTPFPVEQVGVLIRSGCKACKEADRWKACKNHQWVKSEKCQVPNCKGNHESSAVHLDYVGHAEVTARLLELDPLWTWEPLSFDAEGKPAITKRESMAIMWIRLTVNGVTRLGVGNAQVWKDDVDKELIGDALRNAAMRFGIALDLWSKSETLDGGFDAPADPPPAEAPAAPADGEQEERTDNADKGSDASEGESAAPPPEPKKPEGSDPAVDLETVINAFMKLRGQHAKDARLILEDSGLWPVLDIPAERAEEAAALIVPILDLQNKGPKK